MRQGVKKKVVRGFTLIELMVASAVFLTAMSLAVEALFAAQKSYARIDGLRSVLDNLNTAFDIMTRDIRYGTIFYCSNNIEDANRILRQSCPYRGSAGDGGSAIMFRPTGVGNQYSRKGYYLSGGKVYTYVYDASTGATSTVPITGDDVYIDHLKFFVQGANTSPEAVSLEDSDATRDREQPIVTISIAGRAIISSQRTKDSYFHLQTTVAARHLDI